MVAIKEYGSIHKENVNVKSEMHINRSAADIMAITKLLLHQIALHNSGFTRFC